MDGKSAIAGFEIPADGATWTESNQRGRSAADSIVGAMRESGNPLLLGRACQAMIEVGQFGGVQVGFFHRLAERLMEADS